MLLTANARSTDTPRAQPGTAAWVCGPTNSAACATVQLSMQPARFVLNHVTTAASLNRALPSFVNVKPA
jgi:hypothetical protein